MKRVRTMFGRVKKSSKVKTTLTKNVLFIDPGLGGTGYAFFPKVVRIASTPLPPDATGCFTPKWCPSWERRVAEVASWFKGILRGHGVEHVSIEFTEVWFTNPISVSAAAQGDIFKLAYLVGTLAEVTRAECGNTPVLVKPSQWKGQLPKTAMKKRVKKAFQRQFKEHEADAVAMGLAAQGLL